MGLGTHPYVVGLCDVGQGSYAWLQPDGGWGWSNAGLIVDGDEALLVDTLYDVPLTQTMLDGFEAALPGVSITTLAPLGRASMPQAPSFPATRGRPSSSSDVEPAEAA